MAGPKAVPAAIMPAETNHWVNADYHLFPGNICVSGPQNCPLPK